MRNILQDLELVIIDEISMITADMLYLIHQRLCEIFVCDDYFGGKAVLLVGDLLQVKYFHTNKMYENYLSDSISSYHLLKH